MLCLYTYIVKILAFKLFLYVLTTYLMNLFHTWRVGLCCYAVVPPCSCRTISFAISIFMLITIKVIFMSTGSDATHASAFTTELYRGHCSASRKGCLYTNSNSSITFMIRLKFFLVVRLNLNMYLKNLKSIFNSLLL